MKVGWGYNREGLKIDYLTVCYIKEYHSVMQVEQCQNQFASTKSAREREMRYERLCDSEGCRNPHLRKGSVQPTQKVKLLN